MRIGQMRYGDGQVPPVPAVRKDGAQISVEFTIVPFTDDAGQLIGVAAVMRDATVQFEESYMPCAVGSPLTPPRTAALPGRDLTAD
jgi:hypothetical protein